MKFAGALVVSVGSVCASGVALVESNGVSSAEGSSAFMVVSGISGAAEMCLTGGRGRATLKPCVAAIGAGDGASFCNSTCDFQQ